MPAPSGVVHWALLTVARVACGNLRRMLRACFLLPLLLVACASSSAHPEHPEMLDPDPNHDGSSCQRAIVVDAKDEWSGVLQEHMALRGVRGLTVLSQNLVVCDGKKMDVFKVRTPQGTRMVYFDISRYYGKYGK